MFSLRSRNPFRVLALSAALFASLSLAPAPAVAAEAEDAEAGKCQDAAWAEYNTCLMNSGNLEWAKKECDIEFQADYTACYTKVLKGILSLFQAVKN